MSGNESNRMERQVSGLLEALEGRYGKENTGKAEFLSAEVSFAVANGIPLEAALELINPLVSQAAIRELLMAFLEGVPAEKLKTFFELDSPQVMDVSRIRRQYYADMMEETRKEAGRSEAAATTGGNDSISDAEGNTGAGGDAVFSQLYADTLNQFVTEIRHLVSDQQAANRAVMELMTNRESSEKNEMLSVIRSQEKEISSLRSIAAEKDGRISDLQVALQEQIAAMAVQPSENRQVPGTNGDTGNADRSDRDGASCIPRWKKRKPKTRGEEKEELFHLLCKGTVAEDKMTVLINAFDDGVPFDKIKEVCRSPELSASHMKKVLKVYGLKDRAEVENGS